MARNNDWIRLKAREKKGGKKKRKERKKERRKRGEEEIRESSPSLRAIRSRNPNLCDIGDAENIRGFNLNERIPIDCLCGIDDAGVSSAKDQAVKNQTVFDRSN